VNWQERLAHELPFLERQFQAHGVRRVLDAACGTGRHAIALAQRGYQVTGADLSLPMVERARLNAEAAGAGASFAVAGLGQLAVLGETFDALLCLGNSLPHLLTSAEQALALADFAAVLRAGGLLVVQNRNFDRVWKARERFMGPQSYRGDEGEWLFVRFYDFHEATVTFNMVRLSAREGGDWVQTVDATELRPIFHDDLMAALAAAGFGKVTCYGGYDSSAFDPTQSGDLIAVATK
jgi:SAM-dependent methyltransferase